LVGAVSPRQPRAQWRERTGGEKTWGRPGRGSNGPVKEARLRNKGNLKRNRVAKDADSAGLQWSCTDGYVGRKKYLYPYHPTGAGPDRPGDSFRAIGLPARAEGCPLFDRPKRGRKKPHQPALAHMRSRRRAGPRCGGRLGSASGQRIGRARRVILRTRFAQTSIRMAPRCAAWPSLAPHRERPGGGGQSSDEAANPGRVHFLVYLVVLHRWNVVSVVRIGVGSQGAESSRNEGTARFGNAASAHRGRAEPVRVAVQVP